MSFKSQLGRLLRKNIHTYRLFNGINAAILEYFRQRAIPLKYPTDLNIELTTLCNSRCHFCTHEEMIKTDAKKPTNMGIDFARTVLDRLKLITTLQGISDKEIRFSPVGLGEPLLHPHFIDIVQYARTLFPQATRHANTNCIALKGKIAEEMIDCGLDQIRLSLCFNEPALYEKWMGVDRYGRVTENIQNFLRLKGNKPPAATIHIFDLDLDNKRYTRFMEEWTPFLNQNDNLMIEQYLPLTDWSRKKGKKYPCSQLWSVLMVDVNGFVFPCCLGIWTEKENDLCLGHITDDPQVLLAKADEIRNRHIDGQFGICDGCAYLSTCKSANQRFFRRLKKALPVSY